MDRKLMDILWAKFQLFSMALCIIRAFSGYCNIKSIEGSISGQKSRSADAHGICYQSPGRDFLSTLESTCMEWQPDAHTKRWYSLVLNPHTCLVDLVYWRKGEVYSEP